MRYKFFAAMACAFFVAACASSQTTPEQTKLEIAEQNFNAYLDECSATFATDPRVATVGETELAPRELEWRACAYEGVRTILAPATTQPTAFVALIEEDKVMTEKIASGEMTRSARSARIDEVLNQIADKEAVMAPVSKSERDAALIRQVRGLP